MIELYNRISNILDGIDFNSLWNGFHRYSFALYNDKEVILNNNLFPYNERFIGNTAIEYDGEYIAIWNISDNDKDYEELASNIIHEMFHAFQQEKNEERFPNDLVMLDYPNNLANYQIKWDENNILAQIFQTNDIAKKEKLFAQFVSMRKSRANLIGDIILQEYLTETLEGIAEFVGTKALQQISSTKYNARVTKYCQALKTLDIDQFNIRRISYYSGALVGLAADDLKISVRHEIGKTTTTFFELIASNFYRVEFDCTYDKQVASLFDIYTSTKKVKIDDFLSQHQNRITGDFMICGYDPMNMIKSNNQILCEHFAMLLDNTTNEVVQLFHPVLLEIKTDTTNMVSAYIH